jgi:hypothetical protein
MAEVFLSYKREERSTIQALADILRRIGFDVWSDSELRPGDQFAHVINEQLATAGAIVVCWSKEAVTSDWVQGEAHKAHARGVYLSVKVEDCDPPVPFNAFQDADLLTWSAGALRHDGLASLVEALAAKLKKPALAAHYRGLLAEEAAASEKDLADENEEEEPAEQDSEPPVAPQPSYLLHWLSERTDIGSKALTASLTQILFEEEILRDGCTRWIVAETPPANAPQHAKHLTSLQEAIALAQDGDCIAIFPGVYRGRFAIERNIRMIGLGDREQRPTITGDDGDAALDLRADARVENLRIESRDKSHAVRIGVRKAPTIIRCLLGRRQLVDDDAACLHLQGGANPTIVACTVSSAYCPGVRFVANARGTFIASDVAASFSDGAVLHGASRPKFDRCALVAYGGHAVVNLKAAAGSFQSCTLHASDSDAVVIHGGAYSKFVGNRISARRGPLIQLLEGARGVFDHNRLEPDPEARQIEVEKAQERRKLFKRRAVMEREAHPTIAIAGNQRVRFSQNRLPDGSVVQPPNAQPRRRRA